MTAIKPPAPEGKRWEEIERLLAERFSMDDKLTEEQLWKFLRAAYHEGYERGLIEREEST